MERFSTKEEALSFSGKGVESDKLVALKSGSVGSGGRGWCVVDGTESADKPPYIPLINDVRGTRMKANCVLTEGGYLDVIAEGGVPPFQPDKPAEENVDSELRIEYGDSFWSVP